MTVLDWNSMGLFLGECHFQDVFNVCSVLGAWQRETGSPGQASHTTEGERQPRAHLLSDGPHVGHPC